MKPSLVSLALGAALAAATLAVPLITFAQTPNSDVQFYTRPAYFQINGTCETELTPGKAVIVGGVSSSALKPSDAIDQLERQLTAMRAYVTEKHGELQLMERVRTLKNPQPGPEDPDPPFQVVQRLQVTFGADAPVDAILQKLIELGMDRFGDNVLANNGNRREPVIRFRVTDFDSKMDQFQQSCTADAWKQWCARQETGTASGAGTGPGNDCGVGPPPASLELQVFNVHSREALMRPEGNTMAWQWSVNRSVRAPQPSDLLGNLTVHLDGSIMLTYHTEEVRP